MERQNYDVIIVGAGPAGIFAALEILKHKPDARMLILEKGRLVERRICPKRQHKECVNCNPCSITSGWGGAGAFSDGKLSLSSDVGGQIADYVGEDEAARLIKYVDDIYLSYGGKSQVFYDEEFSDEIARKSAIYGLKLIKCPVRHLGTEDSAQIMDKIYGAIKAHPGVDIMTSTSAQSLELDDDRLVGIKITIKDEERLFTAPHVIMAVGREGADWLNLESRRLGLKVTNNAIDIGVRVEVPRAITDYLTDRLYEFKYIYYSDIFENKVRTFCVNPGGFVSQENYDDGLALVNGHSYSNLKSENTNFALLVSSKFTQPFNDPIAYGKSIAKLGNMLTGGKVMVQRLFDLDQGRRTTNSRLAKMAMQPTLKHAVPGDLSYVLPHRHLTSIVEALKALDNMCPGMYGKNTLLYGVEAKFYSSKLDVDTNMETAVKGLYAIGDGAGITRGLIQASITGVVAGRSIAGAAE
ncbi:MAG: NAD(P)/FAD-dependent oxidoreductase [Methylocystaceae bacterium]